MNTDAPFGNGGRGRALAVDWRDCAWQPRIEVRSAPPRRRPATKMPPLAMLDFYPPRRNFPFTKPMKIHLPPSRRHRAAFTIVELLVVIAIIGILAGMLLVVLPRAMNSAKKTQAKSEMQGIVTAIQAYDSAYGRFPVSDAAQNQAVINAKAVKNPNGDFTYGGTFLKPDGTTMQIGTVVSGSIMSNSEVIAILMDLTNYPDGAGPTANMNYVKNPQQTIFLNAKMSGWNPSMSGDPAPGVGSDLVYRDPWGNPYVISMDLSYDEMCQDVFYCLLKVSQQSPGGTAGWNGLISPGISPSNPNNFQYRGKVMVWSAGPDKKIDPGHAANQGVNKDNVLSWQ